MIIKKYGGKRGYTKKQGENTRIANIFFGRRYTELLVGPQVKTALNEAPGSIQRALSIRQKYSHSAER